MRLREPTHKHKLATAKYISSDGDANWNFWKSKGNETDRRHTEKLGLSTDKEIVAGEVIDAYKGKPEMPQFYHKFVWRRSNWEFHNRSEYSAELW